MMRSKRPGARLSIVFGLAATAPACSSDHDLLAKKPDDTMHADVTVIPNDTGGAAGAPNEGGASDGADPEPAGRFALTWVNGLVDVDDARICFVPVVGGREAPADTPPLPKGGLRFAGALSLSSVPHVDWAEDEVHPYLVPRDVESCRDAFPSPPAIEAGPLEAGTDAHLDAAHERDAPVDAAETGVFIDRGVLALPTIPAGTLSAGRSYLLVTTGCMRTWNDVDGGIPSEAICGSKGGANAGIVLVRLSRLSVAPKLGVQVVHASAGTSDLSFHFVQALTQTTLYSVDTLEFGQIAPAHQPAGVSRTDLGFDTAGATVQIEPTGESRFPPVGAKLGDILRVGGLLPASLNETSAFTLVFLGARPGEDEDAASGPSFYPFYATIVPSDPMVNGAD